MFKITNITNNKVLIKETDNMDIAYQVVLIHILIATDILEKQNVPYQLNYIDKDNKCSVEIKTETNNQFLILSEIECEEKIDCWGFLKDTYRILAFNENMRISLKKQ